MSRRLRLTLLASLTTLTVLLAAAMALALVMLRPERFTRTLKENARQAGLQLALAAPARPTFWPRPGVRMNGLQLYVSGQTDPLLIADSGRIVVPWRTVLGGATAITTLRLDNPRLDLNQVRHALARLSADADDDASPTFPRIDTGITISNGALVGDEQVLLKHIDLHTGALVPGQPFILDAEARRTGQPARLVKLTFTPRRDANGAIRLDKLQLDARAGDKASLRLDGKASWQGGAQLALDLAGQWTDEKGQPYRIALTSQPAQDAPQALHLTVDGKAGSADVTLSPARLSAWWKRLAGAYTPGPLPTPPLDGRVKAEQLDIGSLHVKGLDIRSGDALPAAGSSAPAPTPAEAK